MPKVLYLGDWQHAEAVDRLDELNIRRCLSGASLHHSTGMAKDSSSGELARVMTSKDGHATAPRHAMPKGTA